MKSEGFSIIELLIAIAVLLIIAAIAIPNLMNSRMAANESSAVGSMRQINTAEATYSASYSDVGYAQNLQTLGPGSPVSSASAALLDNILGCAHATCTKSGYTFLLSGSNTQFKVVATPLSLGQSGRRAFYTDQSGVIRFNLGGVTAGPNDPPI